MPNLKKTLRLESALEWQKGTSSEVIHSLIVTRTSSGAKYWKCLLFWSCLLTENFIFYTNYSIMLIMKGMMKSPAVTVDCIN
jgi:hypothetical protein